MFSLEKSIPVRANLTGPYRHGSGKWKVQCGRRVPFVSAPSTFHPACSTIINPHYTDQRIAGHGGESRDQRIAEYLEINRESTVVGLREASALQVDGDGVQLYGVGMRVFRRTKMPVDVTGGRTLRTDLKDVDR